MTMESVITAIHALLDNHISSITAIFVAACAVMSIISDWIISNPDHTYDRKTEVVRMTTRVLCLIQLVVTLVVAIFGYVAQCIILLCTSASLITGGLTRLKALRSARVENVDAAELSRRVKRYRDDMLTMAGMLTVLTVMLAPTIWRTADTPSMEEKVIESTSELNSIARTNGFTFVWTPYEIEVDGELRSYEHSANACNVYVFRHGQLVGTDVVYCDNCRDVFTRDVKVASKLDDVVYFLAGNGMLYSYNPHLAESTGTTDYVRAIGENIVDCDWIKGATRYNSYSGTFEAHKWGASEWEETSEDIAFGEIEIHDFFSCQYM